MHSIAYDTRTLLNFSLLIPAYITLHCVLLSLSAEGEVPVGVVYDALQDCVLRPAAGEPSEAGAVRIVSITQTAVRTVFLYGREPADFAPELPAANTEDGDSDDEAAEDAADAAAQQLQPTPQAQWWREAFSLGAGAAVSVALAGGSGSSGSSSTALRSAVMRPSAAVSVEILDVSSEWRLDPAAASSDDDPTDDSDGESESGRRRRLDETGSVGTVLSYAVSVTSTDVLSNTGDDGLAGLIRTLDGDSGGGGDGGAVAAASSSSSSSSSLGFATSLAQGMNAALGLERIANPAFIAGIAMVPFEPPEGSIVEAPTPPAVLTQWQQQQQSGGGAMQFRSEVEYRATSLGTPEALSELLSRGNLATVRNHTRIHMYLLRHFMLEIEMIILARQARDKRIGTAALKQRMRWLFAGAHDARDRRLVGSAAALGVCGGAAAGSAAAARAGDHGIGHCAADCSCDHRLRWAVRAGDTAPENAQEPQGAKKKKKKAASLSVSLSFLGQYLLGYHDMIPKPPGQARGDKRNEC